MKTTFAIAALLSSTQAIKIKGSAAPDVYGPNGRDYENDKAEYDFSRIGINIETKGSGDKCKEGDWAIVEYKGWLKDGRLVTDSTQEKDGRPLTFSVGKAEVFKCWDLAITQLHKGDVARLSCPSFYAWGDAFTWPPIGGEPIPLGSDIEFEFKVNDCNRTPTWTNYYDQPKTTTMRDDTCMYLFWKESDHQRNPLVLATTNLVDDKGRFQLTDLEDFVKGDVNQQWYYNRADGSLKNVAWGAQKLDHLNELGLDKHESTDGKNVAFTATKGVANEINANSKENSVDKYFFYNDALQSVTTDYNGEHYQLSVPLTGDTKTGTVLEFLPIDNDNYAPNGKLAQFRIEYCYNLNY